MPGVLRKRKLRVSSTSESETQTATSQVEAQALSVSGSVSVFAQVLGPAGIPKKRIVIGTWDEDEEPSSGLLEMELVSAEHASKAKGKKSHAKETIVVEGDGCT
ncbi:unnamed protein product [Cuscuta campestris]|uniref:Uncharacterized protein n=1 Tax=Cuscuta campestris TaxID=132261 RepID=A0A484KYA7_9ASTE|nr:unnamed protein product [Cuscuta campestris]